MAIRMVIVRISVTKDNHSNRDQMLDYILDEKGCAVLETKEAICKDVLFAIQGLLDRVTDGTAG